MEPQSPFHEAPGKAANIKVAVRCRPPLDHEKKEGLNTFEKLAVDQQSRAVSAWNERTNSYKTAKFDIVMDQSAAQGKVFELAGMHNIVKHVVGGYHATVFAYGQTGSGKTYTMEGYKYQTVGDKPPQAQFESGDNEGIVPRAIRLLFDLIKQNSNLQKKKFTVYCSYMQIYKEKIYDLLNKSHVKGAVADGPGLKLKWNKNDVFSVENLYTFECKSIDDVMALYHFGIKNKVVASHNMNNCSSRSHSLLSLTVEQIETNNPDNVVVSKLQLVDLAGSERQSQTGNAANKESIDINKSLFTLRQVITALTDRQGQKNSNNYVPYRDSKLTCLLRQSLGGNSYCLMIACLNPCDAQIEENISTLQYASQASYISNKPVINLDPKARAIEILKDQVRALTEELAKANETIDFLSKLTKQNPQDLKANFESVVQLEENQNLPDTRKSKQESPGSAPTERQNRTIEGSSRNRELSRDTSVVEHRQIITQRIVKDQEKVDKFFKEKADQLKNIASYQRQQNPHQPHSAANESKDAITERIVHTVNMMKEVLQGNLSLRETIQRQSEQLDDRNAEMFQLSQENEDLRERLAVLEEYTGKDSLVEVQQLVKEKRHLETRVKHLELTNQNWNKLQKTNQDFFKNQSSQNKRKETATLDNQFNDDFEPSRPNMDDNSFYDAREAVPVRTSNQLMRNNPSNQKMVYDEQNQKAFRVTTTGKSRVNILSKQKFMPQQVQQNQKKNLKAPLPAHSVTDRSKNAMIRASSKVRAPRAIPIKQALFHTKSGRIQELNHTVDESIRSYQNTKIFTNRQSVAEDEPRRPVMPDDLYAISPQISGGSRARIENMSKTDPKALSYPGQPSDTTGLSEPRRTQNQTEYYDEEEEAELDAQVNAFSRN